MRATVTMGTMKKICSAVVTDDYDDGGFSGGNMDRPALKRLKADIEAGKVHIVVVYKIDRLSRSLCAFQRSWTLVSA